MLNGYGDFDIETRLCFFSQNLTRIPLTAHLKSHQSARVG